ncbi:MAG TPA: ABC transporter substrate-binding protein [Burkholderiales bacterium]|jgi:branched-chain amino acid transport system substrate-binding protein|nr:ABC transporter substrate-binding protein [Burkholderiales bacterium]
MSSHFSRRRFNTALAGAGLASAVAPFGIVRAQAQKLKVGVLLPRSGVQGFIGQSCQKGADLAPAVLKQMLGVDIELMNADTETNVDTARTRAERLIQEGAHVLVGPFDSGAASAIAQVSEQRGIPFIVNIAAAPQITEQGYKFTVRNFPTAVDLLRNGLALIGDLFQATNTAPRSAVFMHVNDTFGQSMAKGIGGILPKLTQLPFKIVETIAYDPAAKDLTVEVSKAKATNADFLLNVCRLNDAIILRREMVKQRWQPMAIIGPGNPGMYEEQYYKTLGKLSEYAISNVPWYHPKAEITRMVERQFDKQNPKDKLMYHALNVGYTFEALLIAADAFKRAKTTEPKALNDAIHKTDIKSRMMLGGPIKFNAKGQVEGLASACIQNLNMRPVVVLPANAAEAKPVFPVPGYKKA